METSRDLYRSVAALLFLFPALSLGDDCPLPILGQVQYIGISYDILKGNPEGNQKFGGVDPGLLTTRRVLKFSYGNGKTTADCSHRLPDQVTYTERETYETSQEMDTFYGTKSYAEKLSHQVSVEAGVDTALASFKFGASYEYQSVSNEQNTKGYVYSSDQKIENFGSIRYLKELARINQFTPSRDFRVTVCSLPKTYKKDVYMKFLSDWGTHIVIEAKLGVRSGTTYRMDKSSFIKEASKDTSFGLNIEGSYSIASGSLSMNMDKFTTEASSEEKSDSISKKYAVGSRDYNEPINIKLMAIDAVLDSMFWTREKEYIQNGECEAGWDREAIKSNIADSFKDYPEHRKLNASEDIDVSMKLTWPDGKYAIPEAAGNPGEEPKNCPETTNFKWETGVMAYKGGVNFSSSCEKKSRATDNCGSDSLNLYFCVKSTPKAAVSSWYWMPGVYCIFRVGGKCPKGFKDGSIHYLDLTLVPGITNPYTVPDENKHGLLRTHYCCREDGSTTIPIILPTNTNFYLMKYHSACQEVKGMQVRAESIKWEYTLAKNDGAHPRPGKMEDYVKITYCFYYTGDVTF